MNSITSTSENEMKFPGAAFSPTIKLHSRLG